MPTATKPDSAIAIVTKHELLDLAEAEKNFAKRTKDLAAAKREVEQQRQALAEKVLGITSSDELKQLSPDKIEKKIVRRAEAGEWQLGPGAPEFSFIKTHEGRYPSWVKLYAEQFGESAADKIRDETPLTYSYRVDVEVPA